MKAYFFAAGFIAIAASLIFLSVAASAEKGGNPRRDCISAISEK